MNIKNIVNNTVTTISNCESEPIHIPGSIQPHGALLAVDAVSFNIEFCSENISDYTGKNPAELLGKPFPELFPVTWQQLKDFLLGENISKVPVKVEIGELSLDVMIHNNEPLLVLELEPHYNDSIDALELYNQTEQLVGMIARSKSLKELCQLIADETKRLTGYDRVMIYRFDRDYNGEVFAESKEDDMDSYLGLHYPHTDIPAQARELYLQNLLRLIADVNYDPVPLLTLDNGLQKQLDLSNSTLRSVSPIHIQYLKNMHVGATLTISILLEGRLWGLITCHHKVAKKLSFSRRQAAMLQGHFLSSQIRVRQAADEHEVNLQVDAHLQSLLNKIELEHDFPGKFEQLTSLLAVTNASGAIIMHKGVLYEKGMVPPRDKVMALIKWLGENTKPPQFCTSILKNRYPQAIGIAQWASGIIFHPLGKPQEDCIMWFREEQDKTVNWAGNPNKSVQRDPVTNMLTPRSSFDIWKERVQHTSIEWRVSEVNAAMRFSTALLNYFHTKHIEDEEYRQRMLNEKLLKANEELANINWITSHDLKEPLRKIQIFASTVLSKDEIAQSESVIKNVERIQKSAKRMQSLVEDILSYSLTSEKESVFVTTSLEAILSEVREELTEELEEKKVEIISDKLPVVRAIPHQMRQLFNNLISNAIKFSKANTGTSITITCKKITGEQADQPLLSRNEYYYQITIADNGIGFEPTYNKKIFDIFYRLHNKDTYSGTGIGLAITKKIAENHQGLIVAEGVPGQGASFTFYLLTTMEVE
jgi:chemotaxis family two-component system sensor kinase Cph1